MARVEDQQIILISNKVELAFKMIQDLREALAGVTLMENIIMQVPSVFESLPDYIKNIITKEPIDISEYKESVRTDMEKELDRPVSDTELGVKLSEIKSDFEKVTKKLG